MNDARYYPGAQGRCYLYAKEATFRCPYRDAAHAGDSRTPEQSLLIARAAGAWNAAGITGGPSMELLIWRAHRIGDTLRDPANPARCKSCGALLEKVGHRTWIEAPLDDALHRVTNATTRRLNEALGATHLHVAGSTRYWPTKREAMAWAREEAAIDKQTFRDEVRS